MTNHHPVLRTAMHGAIYEIEPTPDFRERSSTDRTP